MNRLNKFVHAKYQRRFLIACNDTRNKGHGTNLKVEVQINSERNEQKKFEPYAGLCTTVQNFFVHLY